MTNPFKAHEFKELFREWNQILEASGHKEIEDFSLSEPMLKTWNNLDWRKPEIAQKISETTEYFSQARGILHSFSFKSETHRRIWELHCEGQSVRQIEEILTKGHITKSTVSRIIVRIQKKTGLKK